MDRTALILVDIQHDFLPPDGSLAVPDGDKILPPVYRLLDEADKHFALIVASMVCVTYSAYFIGIYLIPIKDCRAYSVLRKGSNDACRPSPPPHIICIHPWQRAIYGDPGSQVKLVGDYYTDALA